MTTRSRFSGIAPYKREFAYDTVNERLDLVVRDPSLVRFSAGGAARPEDDQFYADLEVAFAEGQPVRVPTVGPGARLLAARSVPETELQFFHDSADNWFVKGNREGRVRLVLHVADDRAVFGSPFADIDRESVASGGFCRRSPIARRAPRASGSREQIVVWWTARAPAESLGILAVRYSPWLFTFHGSPGKLERHSTCTGSSPHRRKGFAGIVPTPSR